MFVWWCILRAGLYAAVRDPVLIERTQAEVAGTLLTARLALTHGLAVNTAGGTHHAFPDTGAGFCILNDMAVTTRVWCDVCVCVRVCVCVHLVLRTCMPLPGLMPVLSTGVPHGVTNVCDGVRASLYVCVCVQVLLSEGVVSRVLVCDLDVHQGDGTAVCLA